MQRGALILTVIAGALVFLAVLVLYLPASWFAARLPPQVRCAELGGSVWRGECLGLTLQGGRLGDATWDLSPMSAFTGRLVGDVQVFGDAQRIQASVDLARDGSGEIRAASGHFPLDPALHAKFPPGQRGHIAFAFEELRLAAGAWPAHAKGWIKLSDFRQVTPRPIALGSYEVSFDGTARPDGSLVGRFRNLPGSPFGVEGTITLTPPDSYVGEGMIVGNTAEAEGIVRQITFGTPPNASGRAPFTFAGTL